MWTAQGLSAFLDLLACAERVATCDLFKVHLEHEIRQFGVGIARASITNASTGSRCVCRRKPNCSRNAVVNDGAD